uniref:Uncharacterized protein n=1 Tax=Metarhizium rileyi (strain RCEF 4871) TaxID=1649241 RepID=A0A6H0B7X6_METRR|nr:hypothetical protein [Metarhizium rileyi]QIS49080.1 hypothetical protein [Metarhizium rileyi]
MKLNFNSMWKYIAGGGTVLGYQAFYEVNRKMLNFIIMNMNDKLDLLYHNTEKSNKDKNEVLELNKYLQEVYSIFIIINLEKYTIKVVTKILRNYLNLGKRN